MPIEKMWDKLLEYDISEETLQCVTSINGYNKQALKDILYWKTGYHDFDQIDDEEE